MQTKWSLRKEPRALTDFERIFTNQRERVATKRHYSLFVHWLRSQHHTTPRKYYPLTDEQVNDHESDQSVQQKEGSHDKWYTQSSGFSASFGLDLNCKGGTDDDFRVWVN